MHFAHCRPVRITLNDGRPSKRHPLSKQFQEKSVKSGKPLDNKSNRSKWKMSEQDDQTLDFKKVPTCEYKFTASKKNIKQVQVLLRAVSSEIQTSKDLGRLTTSSVRKQRNKTINDEECSAGLNSNNVPWMEEFAFYVPLAERVKLRRTSRIMSEKEILSCDKSHPTETNSSSKSLDFKKWKRDKYKNFENIEAKEHKTINQVKQKSKMKRIVSKSVSNKRQYRKLKIKEVKLQPSLSKLNCMHGKDGKFLSIKKQRMVFVDAEIKLPINICQMRGIKEETEKKDTWHGKSYDKQAISLKDNLNSRILKLSPLPQICHQVKRKKKTYLSDCMSNQLCEEEEVIIEKINKIQEAENTGFTIEEDLQSPQYVSYKDMPKLSLMIETSSDDRLMTQSQVSMVLSDDCPVLEDCRLYEAQTEITCSESYCRNSCICLKSEIEPHEDKTYKYKYHDAVLECDKKHNLQHQLDVNDCSSTIQIICPTSVIVGNGVSDVSLCCPRISCSSLYSNNLIAATESSFFRDSGEQRRLLRKVTAPKKFLEFSSQIKNVAYTHMSATGQSMSRIGQLFSDISHDLSYSFPVVKLSSQYNCDILDETHNSVTTDVVPHSFNAQNAASDSVQSTCDYRNSSIVTSDLSAVRQQLQCVQKVLLGRGSDSFSSTTPHNWQLIGKPFSTQGDFAMPESSVSNIDLCSVATFPSQFHGGEHFPLPISIVEDQTSPLPLHLPSVTCDFQVTNSSASVDHIIVSNSWNGSPLRMHIPQNIQVTSTCPQLASKTLSSLNGFDFASSSGIQNTSHLHYINFFERGHTNTKEVTVKSATVVL